MISFISPPFAVLPTRSACSLSSVTVTVYVQQDPLLLAFPLLFRNKTLVALQQRLPHYSRYRYLRLHPRIVPRQLMGPVDPAWAGPSAGPGTAHVTVSHFYSVLQSLGSHLKCHLPLTTVLPLTF